METTEKPICDQDSEQEYRQAQEARAIQETRDRMLRCGFPARHIDRSLVNFETPTAAHRQALDAATEYAAGLLPPGQLPAGCALFYGPTGTGKTHLAVGIAKRAAVRHGVKYATVSGLARAVRSSYSKLATKTEDDILADHLSPALLVLDEIGVGLGTDHERAMMHDVIAGRYDRLKPTIFLSNLTISDVKTALGERIVDRIREDRGIMIGCVWESWRVQP